MRVMVVAGARPNFMKVGPLMLQFSTMQQLFDTVFVHTGQHYDDGMSGVFFRDLGIPEPHVNLGVGAGSHAKQVANVMLRLEPLIEDWKPDWVVVPGDVNSTLGAALTAAKMGIRVAHVEAGLRSYDQSMPEEYNRVVTDHVADLLLTPSEDAGQNLRREDISDDRIRFVGNVMIDSLARVMKKADSSPVLHDLGLDGAGGRPTRYVLATLHRPSNVDNQAQLRALIRALGRISHRCPVIFPVHPRARDQVAMLNQVGPDLRLTAPLGYRDFVALERAASLVVTDSGGVQEETTYLGVPCLTVRKNTERPVTVREGTNQVVGVDPDALVSAAEGVLGPTRPRLRKPLPKFWDGRTSGRIVQALVEAHGIALPPSGQDVQGGALDAVAG